MGVRVVWGLGVLVCASPALANVATLDNGVVGTGHMVVNTDDYGFYGNGLSPQNEDDLEVANNNLFVVTWSTGVYLTMKTPDQRISTAVLTDHPKWTKFCEGVTNADGIAGGHPGLTRVVTSQNAVTGSTTQSAFKVGDLADATPLEVSIALQQELTHDATTNTSELRQTYVVTNTGQTALDLKLTATWDPSLIWEDNYDDDITGVRPGFCAVYAYDDNGADQAVVMADGGSSVPLTGYYAGKDRVTPMGGAPDYDTTIPIVFQNHGLPATWINNVAQLGYNIAGENTTVGLDADMGLEWAFPIAVGATETIVIRRIYGTNQFLCPASSTCGDPNLDPGEDCETQGVDTGTCVGAACRTSSCGDGYVNAAAEEECESNGVDTATCIGAMCKASACGDGYINAAAGEQCDDMGESADCNADCTMATCGDGVVNAARGETCESGELCDLATCTTDFDLGGGCAGCASGGDASWLLALGVLALRRRRSLLA